MLFDIHDPFTHERNEWATREAATEDLALIDHMNDTEIHPGEEPGRPLPLLVRLQGGDWTAVAVTGKRRASAGDREEEAAWAWTVVGRWRGKPIPEPTEGEGEGE